VRIPPQLKNVTRISQLQFLIDLIEVRADSAGFERRGRGAFLFLGLVPVLLTASLLWAAQQFAPAKC